MKSIAKAMLLLSVFAAPACVKQKGAADKRGDDSTALSSFAGTGKLCGTHLSFVEFAKDSSAQDAERPFIASIDLAVCGTLNGEKDTEWMALATSLTTSDVYLRTQLEEGLDERGHLARKADGTAVFVGSSGRSVEIGKVPVAEDGEPLTLSTKAEAHLFIDDEPFVLERHGKDQAGKRLVLVAKDAR